MARLVDRRNNAIQAAEREIKRANHEFDKAAVPLSRKINELKKLEAPSEPTVTTHSRKPSATHFDGLTDDEIELFKKLRSGKG